MCSTPAMTVDDTAPSPTRRTPSLPSAGSTPFALDATKSLGSRPMPRRRARSRSVVCHCAGIRPVLAQCCTVLWRLPNSPASADCPPKRSMICFAVFCCVLMAGNPPIKPLVVKPWQRYRGVFHRLTRRVTPADATANRNMDGARNSVVPLAAWCVVDLLRTRTHSDRVTGEGDIPS